MRGCRALIAAERQRPEVETSKIDERLQGCIMHGLFNQEECDWIELGEDGDHW